MDHKQCQNKTYNLFYRNYECLDQYVHAYMCLYYACCVACNMYFIISPAIYESWSPWKALPTLDTFYVY